MKQIYSEKPSQFEKQPKQETVQFLINFSKSISIVKTKSNFNIELTLN
jgi:heme-binding NEAT domain protein